MIPAFTELGLLPAGVHPCSLAQMRAVLATNARREQLFASLEQCLALMHTEGLQGAVLVDGSYVTDKANPGDIELTLDTRHTSRANEDRAIIFHFRNHGALEKIGIDWYPTVKDGRNDFTLFFQYAGEKTAAVKRCNAKDPKGIIRLTKW